MRLYKYSEFNLKDTSQSIKIQEFKFTHFPSAILFKISILLVLPKKLHFFSLFFFFFFILSSFFLQAIKNMLKNVTESNPHDLRPYRILISLLDKSDIGPVILDDILFEVFR